MTQTQGRIGYPPQAFASKIAVWIADRVASRLGLLCKRVALNDERARRNDAIVSKDRARTRFIAMDGDESPLKRRAQPSRAVGAPAESDVAPTTAMKTLQKRVNRRLVKGEAENFLLEFRKVEQPLGCATVTVSRFEEALG
jgi:hypothetical protein